MKLRFFLLFLLLASPVAAADFDLGRVNFPDPVIKVSYDEEVKVLDAQTNLIFLDTADGIGLDYEPAADDVFATEYEIRPSARELGEGDYLFQIVAENTLGLTNTIPETVEFSVTGLNAMLLSPPSGFASTTPYDVELMTFVYGEDDEIIPFNAECGYKLSNTLPSSLDDTTSITATEKITDDPNQYSGSGVGTRHKITGLQTIESTLSLVCQRYYAESETPVPRLLREQFPIGTITKGPELDIMITPPTVYNEQDPTVSIVVGTDQKAFCEISNTQTYPFGDSTEGNYESYTREHVDFISYDNDEGINEIITSTERQEREYTITCTNKAGLSTQEDITITIDYDAIIEISIIEPSSPTNDDPVVVTAQTNIPAECELDGNFMNPEEETIHSIQLPDTAPFENYTTIINCTQEDKTSTIEYNFTTDRIPPNDILINASETVCGNVATAFFEAEDNDQVRGFNWTLKDGSTVIEEGYSTSGQVEVTVPEFTSQELTWEVTVDDRAGNIAQANPVTITVAELNSDVCNPGPFIQYEEPPLGADTEPFTPTIKTKRESVCGSRVNIPGLEPDEGTVNQASSEDEIIHTLPLRINSNQELLVRCVEDDGTTHNKVLDFEVITERPTITQLTADPNPVNDFQSRETTITATTSTETVCQLIKDTTITFDGEDLTDANTYSTDHEHTIDLSDITSLDSQILDYRVACQDRAGQIISQALPITADFSNTQIEVLSPKAYTNDPSPDIIIRPSATSICEYRDPDSGIGGSFNPLAADSEGVHSAGLSVTLDEGAHSILVRCTNSIGEDSLKVISFSIDSIAPTMNPIANDFVCKDASTTIEFNITDDSPVTTRVTIDGNTTNTTADRYEIESTPYNGSVTIEFTPIDAAGNTGTSETRTITVYENGALECTDRAICGNNIVETDEECDDGNLESGDGCSSTCEIEEGTTQPVCGNGVAESGELCDGEDFALTCSFYGLSGTPTTCTADCVPDLSTCSDLPDPSLCGNGVVDEGEFCDGSSLGSASCSEVGLSGSFTECTDFCTPQLSSCTLPPDPLDSSLCGNGVIDTGEECDGSEYSVSCSIYGRQGSASSCTSNCKLDISSCGPLIDDSSDCGNGIVETGEECDGSEIPVTSCQLATNSALSGTIEACNSDCTFDTSTCDGVLTGPTPEPNPEPPEPPTPEPNPEPLPPEEVDEGFPWLALILITLGVVLMGGSGYYLYDVHASRQSQARRPPPMTPQMQQQNTISLEEQKRREQEKLEAYKQKEQEREAKRAKIMSSFESENQETQSQETKEKSSEDSKTQESEQKPKKKSDAFDKLGNMIDETKK